MKLVSGYSLLSPAAAAARFDLPAGYYFVSPDGETAGPYGDPDTTRWAAALHKRGEDCASCYSYLPVVEIDGNCYCEGCAEAIQSGCSSSSAYAS